MQINGQAEASRSSSRTFVRLTRSLLAGFGLLWSIVVLSQTYRDGLSILVSPSHYVVEHTVYFGVGLLTFVISYWILTEEFKRRY